MEEGANLAKVFTYYGLIDRIDGPTTKIICPFHEDVNPSLIANFDEGFWFCFGCQIGGDAEKFFVKVEEKYNNKNDLKATLEYRKILRESNVSDVKFKTNAKKSKKQSRECFENAHYHYYGLKTVDWFNPVTAEEGIALGYMQARGFGPKALNYCSAKATYEEDYGLIFPMLDNGEFKGWVCRTMKPDIEKRRKYLYNKGFSRARTLVGNYGYKNWVMVVEGYMDMLKCVQNGMTNVVAILGWKASEEQINKLKREGIEIVVSALDNDGPGRKGTEYLRNFFKVVRFNYIKGIKDPGDMTQDQFDKMFNRTKQNSERQNIFLN